jgi:hypothetical protein
MSDTWLRMFAVHGQNRKNRRRPALIMTNIDFGVEILYIFLSTGG